MTHLYFGIIFKNSNKKNYNTPKNDNISIEVLNKFMLTNFKRTFIEIKNYYFKILPNLKFENNHLFD